MHVSISIQGNVNWLTLKMKALQFFKMLGLLTPWHSITFH